MKVTIKRTNPVENFIPRHSASKDLMQTLNIFSIGLEEIVNFGSHVFQWYIESVRGGDEHLPVAMSLRHFLELIDAISIQVKHSSIDPCKLQLRGALETYFSLEYLLEKDTDDRAMAFLVCHTHHNLKIYHKFDNTTESGKQFQKAFDDDKLISGLFIRNNPDLQLSINNLNSLLQKPHFQKAENEYQRLQQTKEKNAHWYRFFDGPKNIKELADYLNLGALYEVLYRQWSGPIHSTDIIQGKLFGSPGAGIDIVQIRYPKSAQEVTSFAMTLSIRVLSLFIKKYLPSKNPEYQEWYLSSIRDLYIITSGKAQLIDLK